MVRFSLLLFFLTSNLYGQNVWLRVISHPAQKLSYPTKSTSIEERSENLNKLLTNCREKGMLTASIDSTEIKGDTLIAHLITGPVYRWAEISKGNMNLKAMPANVFKETIFRKTILSPKQLTQLLQKILNYYQNNGFPFASVGFDSVSHHDYFFSAKLNIRTGDLFLIDSLNYRGNARISNRYLEKYLDIQPGDVYNEEQIRQINIRLRELPFIQPYKPADIFLVDKAALIRLYLNEKKASNFNGIIGLMPDNTKEGKILITGEANLKIRNGLGKGESIDVEWKRLQASTQSLITSIAWPFLFNLPFGFSGTFNLYKKDTSFLNTRLNMGIQYLMKGTNYLKAYYEIKNSSLLSTKGLSNITVLPDFADINSSLYGLELNITKLNYRYNPRNGYHIIVKSSAGNRKIHPNANVNPQIYNQTPLSSIQINYESLAELYTPLFKKSTFKTGIKAAHLQSLSLFENELFRIGGLNSLRGFNEESIFASSFAIINLEYRYLFEENAYLCMFINGAWYENKAINRNIADLPLGFGAGISFETKAGVLNVNYALGTEQKNPIQFRNAKIHFGLSSLF